MNPCKRCKKRLGNNGLPVLMARTESDVGGYYPAHVLCTQCGHRGPGRATEAIAVLAWNRQQQ